MVRQGVVGFVYGPPRPGEGGVQGGVQQRLLQGPGGRGGGERGSVGGGQGDPQGRPTDSQACKDGQDEAGGGVAGKEGQGGGVCGGWGRVGRRGRGGGGGGGPWGGRAPAALPCVLPPCSARGSRRQPLIPCPLSMLAGGPRVGPAAGSGGRAARRSVGRGAAVPAGAQSRARGGQSAVWRRSRGGLQRAVHPREQLGPQRAALGGGLRGRCAPSRADGERGAGAAVVTAAAPPAAPDANSTPRTLYCILQGRQLQQQHGTGVWRKAKTRGAQGGGARSA